MDQQEKERWLKLSTLSALVLVCVIMTLIVNVYGRDQTLYTQLFYVPILLAALWYHRKAVVLALFFGLLHISANYVAFGTFDTQPFLRASILVFVGAIASWMAEQKDAFNDRLKRSNSELSNIIEFYPDATLIIDNDGRVVAWNRAMEEMTGVRAADMIGKGDMEYAVPFYGKPLPMLINLVGQPEEEIRTKYSDVTVRNGRLEAIATSARIRGNDAPVLHGTASKMCDDSGRPIGAIESVRDISDRKRMEQLQRDSDERFRNVVNSTMDAIVSTDVDMNIVLWNKAAERIFGYSAAEVIGRSITMLMPEEVQPEFEKAKERYANGKPIRILNRLIEYTTLRKDGTRFPVEMSLSIWTESGKAIFSAVIRDITERKASEEALSYKNRELSMISSIVGLINRSDSIEEVLEGTLSGSLELLRMDAGVIYLADPADRSRLAMRAFVPRTEAGLDMEPCKTVRADPSLNAERVYHCADGGTSLFPEIFVGRTATIIVPILLKGFAIGLMAFGSEAAPAGHREMPDLLSIGSQLGIAIDNHTLMRTLRAASNYMAEIINESPDAIITADAQGNIISSNKRVARLLQYDMAALSSMNVRQLLPPGAAGLVLEGDRSYVRDFMRRDGTVVTLNISTSRFESGDVQGGFIIALKDLSEIAGLKIVPIAENAVEGIQRYHFEKGSIYLLDKTRGGDGIDIFADQVKHNIQGLCVTRQNPKKIRELYGLEKTPIVWLNGSDLPNGESCIKPDNLTGLGATVYKFLSEADDGVVLLDGVEYLVARNSFESVLKFLHLLNDRVMVSHCSVLLCLDPLSLETRQFHLLKTELREFEEG
jgi:PAS domain S-box-containing protein